MKYLKYLFLGIIQGFTEPLPISSSAHILIFGHFLKLDNIDLSFEIFVNFASTLAILLFFIKPIKTLIHNSIRNNNDNYLNRQYLLKLILASIPVILVGFLLGDFIDEYFVNFYASACCLIITSGLLIYSAFIIKKRSLHLVTDITTLNALMIGVMQSIALVPGLSRSGSTLTMGLSGGAKMKPVLQFSFFLYLIASFGAFILALFKLDYQTIEVLPLLLAFVGAFLTTSLSIRWFFQLLNYRLLWGFAIYTLIVGLGSLVLNYFLY